MPLSSLRRKNALQAKKRIKGKSRHRHRGEGRKASVLGERRKPQIPVSLLRNPTDTFLKTCWRAGSKLARRSCHWALRTSMFPNFQSRVGKLVDSWKGIGTTSIQVPEETVSSTAYSLRYHFGPVANKAGALHWHHDAQVRATRAASSSVAGLSRVSVCLFVYLFLTNFKVQRCTWSFDFLEGLHVYLANSPIAERSYCLYRM